MVSVNDFAPGDRVHLLSERNGFRSEPLLRDGTVKRVRNGYVWVSTDQAGCSRPEKAFCKRGSADSFLTEEDQIGWGDMLFRHRADAEAILLLRKQPSAFRHRVMPAGCDSHERK